MSTHSVTVHLPDPLYGQLKLRAEQTKRTVEIELLEALATSMPEQEDLPAELADVVAPLPSLDDDALWRLARGRLPRRASARLERLHLQAQASALTDDEAREELRLMDDYERAILVRAEAARLLRQRGYDVGRLVARQ